MSLPEGAIRVFDALPAPLRASRPRTAAVIVAAGGSTRMGMPKQRIPLCGIPVLARTLRAFEDAGLVDEVVVVARRKDMADFAALCREWGIHKAVWVLPGGETRQESVARGVAAVGAGADYLAIHDGARPLIRPAVIDRVIAAAYEEGAAAAGVRVKDTVKTADSRGFITGTPDRRFLWNVQTPQVFERRLYLRALEAAQAEGLDFTDDCQLAEHIGCPVRLVEADYDNLKITTPEDVAIAESLLRSREEPARPE